MLYYFSYPTKGRITGANLFYSRIAEILEGKGTLIESFWDFVNGGIKKLTQKDVLVTNNGPYAFIFAYLRKSNGQKFRIIRDVQTSLHCSYLFQEMVLQEFTQENDAVLFPSNYTRNLYLKIFPDLKNSFVCYPLIESFPKINRTPPREFTVGYLGRASLAKNFDQIINIAKKIKGNILVGGAIDFKELPDNVIQLGNVDDIWEFFSKISVLAFPSTANIESLGRVLLEANHAGVPSVTAEFGASPELSPNNVKITSFRNEEELLHNHPLGVIDELEFIEKLNYKNLGSNEFYQNHDKLFLQIIMGNARSQERIKLNPNVENFIALTKIYINADYKIGNVEAIREYIALLKKEELFEIGQTSHNILKTLKFVPKWNLS